MLISQTAKDKHKNELKNSLKLNKISEQMFEEKLNTTIQEIKNIM